MTSTLYQVQQLPDDLGGAVVVSVPSASVVVLHVAPDAPAPDGATVLYGGTRKAWTWGGFASVHARIAKVCIPHEWSGESTARDVVDNDSRFYQAPPEG